MISLRRDYFQRIVLLHSGGRNYTQRGFRTLMPLVFGEGHDTPLQYSCLENPLDGGAWKAAVHGVARSRTQLSDSLSLSLFTFMHWRRKWQPTPVFLPGESQGRGSLLRCRLWGRTESDTTEATQQQQQPQPYSCPPDQRPQAGQP